MYHPTALGAEWLSRLSIKHSKIFKDNIIAFNDKEIKHSIQNKKLWALKSLGIVDDYKRNNETFYILNNKFFTWEK